MFADGIIEAVVSADERGAGEREEDRDVAKPTLSSLCDVSSRRRRRAPGHTAGDFSSRGTNLSLNTFHSHRANMHTGVRAHFWGFTSHLNTRCANSFLTAVQAPLTAVSDGDRCPPRSRGAPRAPAPAPRRPARRPRADCGRQQLQRRASDARRHARALRAQRPDPLLPGGGTALAPGTRTQAQSL